MKKLIPVFLALFFFSCKKEEVKKTITPVVYTDSVADIDGNYYHTITIGTQVWMAENLRVTHYQNGDTIRNQTTSNWSVFYNHAYCFYNNDSAAQKIYGNLYSYGAVTDTRNICPVGWHIPTKTEYQVLLNHLGTHAGDKLREAGTKHWFPPNDNATNESGFSALPGGMRDDNSGDFNLVRHEAFFWTVSPDLFAVYPQAWSLHVVGDRDPDTSPETTEFLSLGDRYGCAVRCIKD